MLINGYLWKRLQTADQDEEKDQEPDQQVERTSGIGRRMKPARRFLQAWK